MLWSRTDREAGAVNSRRARACCGRESFVGILESRQLQTSSTGDPPRPLALVPAIARGASAARPGEDLAVIRSCAGRVGNHGRQIAQ
jgi:hypothetical protein